MTKLRAWKMALGVFLVTMALSAPAQTLNVLYNFGTNSGDPLFPLYAGLIAQGQDGSLYGTTPLGGSLNDGAVFKVTPAGTMTVLHSFGEGDGEAPFGGLTLGTDGNLYGTTFFTIFKITSSGQLTTLYSFSGDSDPNGWEPYAPPVQGADGNFYGATSAGAFDGGGAVYRITPSGSITRLHSFSVSDGYTPYDALIQGVDGNFYGTTSQGGSGSVGTVFRITPTGTLTVLYNFDTTHGATSYSSLIQASDGNFYGTTEAGGSFGYGVIFRMTPAGQLTVLHNFTGGSDGGNPTAGLTLATDGNFYGTTDVGGTLDDGVVFKLTPLGTFSVVYNFDVVHGAYPVTPLIQNTNGKFYGDAQEGGTANEGTFFSLDVSLGPFVRLVPAAGWFQQTIGILGQGFSGTTGVSFNGAAAKFNVVSDTYITALVPVSATTGLVTVVTPSGTLTSNQPFRILPRVSARP
jgi:uncharacterized repeat protein (TIGR03803 family)